MKKHAVIPIFIPHLGCPNDCVFCDQRSITARSMAPSEEEVRRTFETWLSTLDQVETVEAAFYGGSFTGIPREEQCRYLGIAREYLLAGRIRGIRLSTRPDYITEEIADELIRFGVTAVELGVQSFDDEVLRLSNRGCTSEDARRAARILRSTGLPFGIQLMIGLPGDSLESCIRSAEETVKLGASMARLYPTVVLRNTSLMTMLEQGAYAPLSQEEAVTRTAAMYRILEEAGITILRVGLKSTDLIGSGDERDAAFTGYHPAFRELVEGRIFRDKIEEALLKMGLGEKPLEGDPHAEQGFPTEQALPAARDIPSEQDHPATRNFPAALGSADPRRRRAVTIRTAPSSISRAAGHKAENKKYFQKKYPWLELRFAPEEDIPPGEVRVTKLP